MTTTSSSDTLFRSFGKVAKELGARTLRFLDSEKGPLLFTAAVIGSGLASPCGPGAGIAGTMVLAGNGIAFTQRKYRESTVVPFALALTGFVLGVAGALSPSPPSLHPAIFNAPVGSIQEYQPPFMSKTGFNLDKITRQIVAADGDSRTIVVSNLDFKDVYTAFKTEGQWFAANVDKDLSCRDEKTLILSGTALTPEGKWNHQERKELALPVTTQAPREQMLIAIGGKIFTPLAKSPCEIGKEAFIKRTKDFALTPR